MDWLNNNWMWHYSGSSPSSPQLEAFTDFSHRLLVFLGGYGSGKTWLLAHKAVALSILNAGTVVGAVGDDYAAAKQDLIPSIAEVLDINRVHYQYHGTEMWFRIHEWPGVIKVASAEKPETLKGPTWSAAVGNEPGLWPHESFLNLLSRVRDPLSNIRQVVLGGTPEGFNWLYKETDRRYPRARSGQDAYCRIIGSVTMDATWLPKDYYETLKATYPSELLEEKLMGRFVAVGRNQAYSAFDRAEHTVTLRELYPTPLILCLDFNIAPAIAVIHQRIPHPDLGSVTYAVGEIYLERGTTGEVMRIFDARYRDHVDRYGMEYVGDATGESQHATGHRCYDDVREALRGLDARDRVPTHNPPVADRLAVVNGCIEHGKYYVDSERCPNLVEDLEHTRVVPGQRKIDKSMSVRKDSPSRSHLTDAAGYDLYDAYAIPRVEAVRAESRSATRFEWPEE